MNKSLTDNQAFNFFKYFRTFVKSFCNRRIDPKLGKIAELFGFEKLVYECRKARKIYFTY